MTVGKEPAAPAPIVRHDDPPEVWMTVAVA